MRVDSLIQTDVKDRGITLDIAGELNQELINKQLVLIPNVQEAVIEQNNTNTSPVQEMSQ